MQIVGIDLGTTNSEIAVVQEERVVVIKVDGSELLPSVVSLNEQGQILVGTPALNNELLAPHNTIRRIKRKMGSNELVVMNGVSYTPSMISSLILKRLKLAAEDYLGYPVSKAVITVPAFFNEQQREATSQAAKLAGLELVRLLNEPTAAAIAYTLGKGKRGNYLVYDLGGGTFDVSIVNISEEIMEVRASHGDTALGGVDFDRMIAEKARVAFLKEYHIDLAQHPLAWARVLRAAEQAKIWLSTESSATLAEEFIATKAGVPLHLHFTISRTEFEEMIEPTLERTLDSVRMALEMASLQPSALERVILVGGSTYIPLVAQMLEKELNIVAQTWHNPSTVVALGAAIEAANLAGQTIGPRTVDITPHSLGISCINDSGGLYHHILIRCNTPLPCSASQVFYKMFPEQERIKVTVHQGESSDIAHVVCLGEFLLEELGESTKSDIHIKFHLDSSGLLHVTATDICSGKHTTHTLSRDASTAVQQADLTLLNSVRILVEEEAEDTDLTSDLPIYSDDSEELFERASMLIEEDDLSEKDRDELMQELAAARTGNKEALQRLSDLLFCLSD
jgi:molecular chaperone DnaK